MWLDALANYLTVAKFGEKNNSEFGEIWPPEVQIVGKDILRFHAVIWPAILTALNLELPKKIIAHGHWTSDGQKMRYLFLFIFAVFFLIFNFNF